MHLVSATFLHTLAGRDSFSSELTVRSHCLSNPWPLEWANKNHLSLLCSAPTDAADMQHHLVSYPILAILLTRSSPPLDVMAGTFSRNMNLGLISLAKRTISKTNPLRSPSNPFPSPAILMSWHNYGKPPKMISTSLVTSGSPLNLIGSLCLCHSW